MHAKGRQSDQEVELSNCWKLDAVNAQLPNIRSSIGRSTSGKLLTQQESSHELEEEAAQERWFGRKHRPGGHLSYADKIVEAFFVFDQWPPFYLLQQHHVVNQVPKRATESCPNVQEDNPHRTEVRATR